ncbi:unnamed protein product [Cladocopium goreaui]|uniref:Uncharacterized protein n=1 Tax=Cladocopium goreaui TaxID=2562237 RepID=A0A9P1FHY3_9DINO|nr:unnamed protein product [Cladocopium goreaui]
MWKMFGNRMGLMDQPSPEGAMGKKKQAAKPTTFYDSLVEMTTINFEELAEEENWETMSQLERKMTEARVAFDEQKVQERAARQEARKAREKKIRAKKQGGENISGPFRRPCGVPQEVPRAETCGNDGPPRALQMVQQGKSSCLPRSWSSTADLR